MAPRCGDMAIINGHKQSHIDCGTGNGCWCCWCCWCCSLLHALFRARTVLPSSCVQVGTPLLSSQPADINRCSNRFPQYLAFVCWRRFEDSFVFVRCLACSQDGVNWLAWRCCLWVAEIVRQSGVRRWNDTDRGKPMCWEKLLSLCHFVHHKSRMD